LRGLCSVISEVAIRVLSRRLREVLRWREYLPAVVKAVEGVLGDVDVYVFGSAVEGGLTASSDVDVAVVIDRVPESAMGRARIVSRVWEVLEREGVPWWYPLEIHLMTEEELERLRRGGARFVSARELIK